MGKVLNVAITGAAGQIGYTLLFCIGSGKAFGPNTKVALRLLEITPALQALEGVIMELDDCAYPLLESIVATDDPRVAFDGIDWALMVGARPRGKGMERGDLIRANGPIFVEQGRALMTISSRELVETLSQLRQAEANLDAAAAVAERYRSLAEKKIASPTRAAETEAQRKALQAVVEEHMRLVSLGNIKTIAGEPRWSKLADIIQSVNRTRGYGDFYHYHLLAAGKIDIVLESDVNILDIAALSVIVTEAGGRFTDLDGGALNLDTTTVLACNSAAMHERITRILGG